jgi:hypothetical protein
MNLYKQILVVYPQLTEADFMLGGVIDLADNSDGNGPFIRNWTHPTLTKPTPEQLAAANLQSEPVTAQEKYQTDLAAAKLDAKLNAIKNMSAAEIQTWMTSNVTTLAQARDVLTSMAKIIAILLRRL